MKCKVPFEIFTQIPKMLFDWYENREKTIENLLALLTGAKDSGFITQEELEAIEIVFDDSEGKDTMDIFKGVTAIIGEPEIDLEETDEG